MAQQSMIPYYQPSERLGLSIADLIMRRGDIAAQRAMNSGQIWGQALSNVGQIASGAIQQHQERKSQEKREQALNTALESWDGKDLGTLYRSVAPVVGPEAGLKVTEGFGAILSSREKQQPDPEDFFKKVAGVRALKDKMGPEWMAKNWQGIAPVLATDAKAFLGVDLGGEFTPEYAQALDTLDDEYSAKKPQEALKPMVVSGRLVQPTPEGGAKVLYEPPPEVPKPVAEPKPGSFEAFVAANPGEDVLQLRAQWEAAGRAPKESVAPQEFTLNPEGVVLSSYGVRQKDEVRRQAMERGLPVFENAAAQNKGVVLEGIVADAQELRTLLSLDKVKDAIGPAAGRWTQLKGKVFDLDPDIQRAIQLMTSLSDTELRKRSGAQINEKEMQRILRFAADPNRPYGHNITAINGILKSGARDYKSLSGVDISGGLWESGDKGPAEPAPAKLGEKSALLKKYGF